MPVILPSALISVTETRKETGMQSVIQPTEYIHHRKSRKEAIVIRPVLPGDEQGLRRMLSRLSRESIHLRFHAPLPRAPEWAVAMFVDPDRRCGESLVAVAGGEVVGHAIYVREGDSAEFAMVVEDRCQARGIGKRLLSALAESAGREGVKCFTGAVLGENRRMFGLLRSAFERVGYALEGGAYAVSAPLL
jgi:GNAT superfamily N-acetyltransferase